MAIELAVSRSLSEFIPILVDIDDLGDRFLLSMLHWCGVGSRSAPLQFWQVYLARRQDNREVVGVCGLYQNPGMPRDIGWLSWLGVRRSYRRQGFGGKMVRELVTLAKREFDFLELWVYTDPMDSAVHAFYSSIGFKRVGLGGDVAPDVVMSPEDIVFRMELG